MGLATTFREHIVFHVLKNDSQWSFYGVLFMQKLNSIYQNLYDYESDFEMRQIVERMYDISYFQFFREMKRMTNKQMVEFLTMDHVKQIMKNDFKFKLTTKEEKLLSLS